MENPKPVLIKIRIHKELNVKFEEEYLEIAESVLSKSTKNIERDCIIRPFILALINRAMVTSSAIETLISCENYESVLPLLRILFDCGLQIKAATMTDNVDGFYRTYGKSKAKKGTGKIQKTISEGQVARSLDDDKWTSGAYNLYKFLCEYIHFSPRHYSLLSNDTSSLSIGKLILRDNQDSVTEIKQCYDDTSEVVTDIFRYYIDELWN